MAEDRWLLQGQVQLAERPALGNFYKQCRDACRQHFRERSSQPSSVVGLTCVERLFGFDDRRNSCVDAHLVLNSPGDSSPAKPTIYFRELVQEEVDLLMDVLKQIGYLNRQLYQTSFECETIGTQ